MKKELWNTVEESEKFSAWDDSIVRLKSSILSSTNY